MDIYRFRLPGFERPYTREIRNKAFLVVTTTELPSKHKLNFFEKEMCELARSAKLNVFGTSVFFLARPSARYLIGSGKLDEIKAEIGRCGANVLVFNVDLTPAQNSNIEKLLQCPVIDRTGLILEIFGRRAKSKEGKLQVELAQLFYALPRIGGLGTVMSRLGGGVGTRGPGEQELERDRRKIRKRIQSVKQDLKKMSKHRKLLRTRRKKSNYFTVALVGYTNAGKSTLLNALTRAGTETADKMFATLDTKTRMSFSERYGKLLFVDTVGFLDHLPHNLVEAFHATLEEVNEADLLAHVLDASSENPEHLKACVESVLKEIHAERVPRILVLNKTDLLDEKSMEQLKKQWPEAVLISARQKQGMEELKERVHQALLSTQTQ